MEIQDIDLHDQTNHAQVAGMDSVVGGEIASRTFPEITDIHVDFPRVDAYEEVVNIVNDYPSLQKDMAENTPQQMRPHITKSVNENDASCYDSGIAGETAHAKSLYANDHKPIRVFNAADEIDLMDNDTHESCGDMVAVEYKAHEDQLVNIMKAADATDLMDNDIYESSGGDMVVEHDTP